MKDHHNTEFRTRSKSPSESQSTFKVRCPECFKMYAVRTDEVAESKPRFQCVSCSTQFWVSYPECLESQEGTIGFPLEWLKTHGDTEVAEEVSTPVDEKAFSCPKCAEPYAAGDAECNKCGLVFEKFFEMGKSKSVSASAELKSLWERVIENYDSNLAHQDFIEACQKEDNLAYASNKYRSILEACSDDEQAQKSQGEILAIAESRAKSLFSSQTQPSQIKKMFGQIRITGIIIFLSAMVIAVGYLVPGMRNLMGMGASILFIALAFRYYFKVR